MTKRPPPDEQPDGHRDIKRIRIEYAEAKEKKKAAEDHYYALMNELARHPVEKADEAAKAKELDLNDLKQFFPPYLYDILVVKGSPEYGRLSQVTMYQDWPDSSHMHDMCFELRIRFDDGSPYSYTIDVDTERTEYEIELGGVRVPHAQITLKSSLEAAKKQLPMVLLWQNALQFNDNHVPKAVAGLILWAMNKSRLDAVDSEVDFEALYSMRDVGRKLHKLKGAKLIESKSEDKTKVIDVSDGSANASDDSSSSSSE